MMENKFLVVTDMQKNVANSAEIADKAAKKIEEYKDYVFFTKIKDGGDFDDKVNSVLKYNRVFEKPSYGSFDVAREINARHGFEIEVIGACTDTGVLANVLIMRSMMPDIKIIVDSSCCVGTTPEKHKNALEIMKNCGIEVK